MPSYLKLSQVRIAILNAWRPLAVTLCFLWPTQLCAGESESGGALVITLPGGKSGADFGRVLTTLFNASTPPTESYTFKSGDTICAVLRDRNYPPLCITIVNAILTLNPEFKGNYDQIAPGTQFKLPKYRVQPHPAIPVVPPNGSRFDGYTAYRLIIPVVSKEQSTALITSLAALPGIKVESRQTYSEAPEWRYESAIPVEWRSDNRTARDLALEMERLYVVLYNTGNLPTRSITNPDQAGGPIELILRSEDLFFGEFFPEGIDAVMCDINPEVCARDKSAVPERELDIVENHVGGYLKSRGRWSNQARSTIVVPNLTFETYTTIAAMPYFAGDNLEQLVNRQAADCSSWGISCLELVRHLNPVLLDTKRSLQQKPTTVMVPVQGVKTDLALTGIEGSKLQSVVNRLEAVNTVQTKRAADPFSGFAGGWRSKVQRASPADIGFDALSNNISSFGVVEAQSSTDPHSEDETTLLELIHYPFDPPIEVGPEYKKPVSVVVFDNWLDKGHCALNNNIEIDESLNQEAGGSNRAAMTGCGVLMSEIPNEPDDHGTHTVGIIGANNVNGVVGLNPFARLIFVRVNMIKLQDSQERHRLGAKMLELIFQKPIKVANISWKYSNETGNDAILRAIQTLQQNTLFVVAAGNNNQLREGGACGDYPACYRDEPNVLTVVGLDRSKDSPQIWTESEQKGSNWGQNFGIGAIAKDVLSTTYGGRTGRMSGTSQAAPQVAAAASLIYSKYQSSFAIEAPVLTPIEVKNRLIYTADLFTELLPKAQGSRLNIERALDMAVDQVEIKVEHEVKKYKGKLVDFGPGYIECEGSSRLQIPRQSLRRMFYDNNRRKYVVFYNKDKDNLGSELLREPNCELTTRKNMASIEAEPDEKEVVFEFRQIRDFTSAMFK